MIEFIKYSATGNDFVVVDNRQDQLDVKNKSFWQRVCDRHFGVGADGILFLETPVAKTAAYRMRYLNADGGEVSMCGNGARALCHYYQTQVSKKFENVKFETAGSVYEGQVEADGRVSIVMSELYDEGAISVGDLYSTASYSYYLNTGVPHCVYLVGDVDNLDIMGVAPRIRKDSRFENGTNVNFYQVLDGTHLRVRTFERGVEGETLSCGTGVVATVVSELRRLKKATGKFSVTAKGGELEVEVQDQKIIYRGEVLQAFAGKIMLKP